MSVGNAQGFSSRTMAVGKTSPSRGYCSRCPLVHVCLPADLDSEDVKRFENMILGQRSVAAGHYLFHVGDAFKSLFAIREGSFKTSLTDQQARQHVLNFHLPGELIGFDAVYLTKHPCNAVALSDAIVCNLPFSDVLKASEKLQGLQRRLLQLVSREAVYTHGLTGNWTAAERMAAFLVSISQRLRHVHHSEKEFELPMSREDIANHLRLAIATVSRVLTRFQNERLIAVVRKQVTVLDLDRLRELAAPMIPSGLR